MDPELYTAAMENNHQFLEKYSAESADQFALQVTPNSNTVLHVAAQFDSAECAEYILSKCPSLLCRVNADGNTPIHVAVAPYRYRVLSSLINFPRSEGGGGAAQVRAILRARNHDGDTPLHLAARSYKIFSFLELFLTETIPGIDHGPNKAGETQKNPGFDHGPNKAGETPVYLFMKWGYSFEGDMLHKLLKTCTLLECGGPEGRTALHAAVIHRKDEFLDELMKWKIDLIIKEPDTYGWTPLHYAAQNRDVEAVKKLLDKDKSVAYVTANNDQGNTALHMASAQGYTEVMELILSKCPDCWEIGNSKRQNILHISADMKRDKATKYISKQKWAIDLVNQKDHEGNTPMHVIAHKGNKNLFFLFYGFDWEASNNEGLTPSNILLPKFGPYRWLVRRDIVGKIQKMDEGKNWPLRRRFLFKVDKMDQGEKGKTTRGNEEYRAAKEVAKMTDTHMIVATLISTMSFTAGFTLPGGYHQDTDPNKGTAVLVREAAFKAFVITNTIAVVCSTSSVFLYVSASLLNTSGPEGERRAHRHAIAFGLIIAAMLAMMVAFSTGAYAVLSDSLGLAIVTCVIGCSSSIVYAVELKKHLTDEIEAFLDTLRFWGTILVEIVLFFRWILSK